MKPIEMKCPKCKSETKELIACENCGAIGCTRCMKKKYGRWTCHKCETPQRSYDNYYSNHSAENKNDDDVNSAFSAMFG